MTATLHQLIDSLRNEVQHYGELLAQMEAQQGMVCHPGAGSVLGSIVRLQAQAGVLTAARASRDQIQRQLAWSLGRTEPTPVTELLPLMPGEYRPLVSALVEEVEYLLGRARDSAQQNYLQLRQSLHFMEHILARLPAEALSVQAPQDSNPSRTDQPPSPPPSPPPPVLAGWN